MPGGEMFVTGEAAGMMTWHPEGFAPGLHGGSPATGFGIAAGCACGCGCFGAACGIVELEAGAGGIGGSFGGNFGKFGGACCFCGIGGACGLAVGDGTFAAAAAAALVAAATSAVAADVVVVVAAVGGFPDIVVTPP